MRRVIFGLLVTLVCWPLEMSAQDAAFLKKRWSEVATRMPAEWYASEAAMEVARQVVFCQQTAGGWVKNEPYHRPLTAVQSAAVAARRDEPGATIDNGATVLEMRFLARVYKNQGGEALREAFVRGLDYLLEAQYDNGGWPQFYPPRSPGHYSEHITYNDNAMVNVLELLRALPGEDDFLSLKLDEKRLDRAQQAFDAGIACILATQIVVEGVPTVWCAQHHKDTLEPVKARAYELPSFSGAESAGIALLLMEMETPSKTVIRAVEGAVAWFEANKQNDIALEWFEDEHGDPDRRVVHKKGATPLWGRFCDLKTMQPFFCDRDGIKKWSLEEIGRERRAGYAWYTDKPAAVLKRYPEWRKKVGL